MSSVKHRQSQTLVYDSTTFDKDVAKSLPPDVAFSFHVLPLAFEHDCLTVAMADPENKFAIQAVASAMGREPYVVRSDQDQIDHFLVELWPHYHQNDLQILLIHSTEMSAEGLKDLNENLCSMFRVSPSDIHSSKGLGHDISDSLTRKEGEIDLIVIAESSHPRSIIQKMEPAVGKTMRRTNLPILIARDIRCPIRKALIIVDGDSEDHIGIDWTFKVAHSSNTEVDLFVVVPPLPGMYQGLRSMSFNGPRLMAGDSALSRHIQCMIDRLESHGIRGSLKLREGSYRTMVQQALNEEDYGLVLIAAGRKSWLHRLFLDDPLNFVFRYAKSPIFLARSPYQHKTKG